MAFKIIEFVKLKLFKGINFQINGHLWLVYEFN